MGERDIAFAVVQKAKKAWNKEWCAAQAAFEPVIAERTALLVRALAEIEKTTPITHADGCAGWGWGPRCTCGADAANRERAGLVEEMKGALK